MEAASAKPDNPVGHGHLRCGQAVAMGQEACGSHGAHVYLWDDQICRENMGTQDSWPMGTPDKNFWLGYTHNEY